MERFPSLIILFSWISLQLKNPERVLGLILISPLCRAPSWSEWFFNKVSLCFLLIYIFYHWVLCIWNLPTTQFTERLLKSHILSAVDGKPLILLWNVQYGKGDPSWAFFQPSKFLDKILLSMFNCTSTGKI